ncbi:MAG: PAS domain S-box protein [Bacteroidales bacterium]|nr:PAS domain S-box protein [Bacteroidales bacterium]
MDYAKLTKKQLIEKLITLTKEIKEFSVSEPEAQYRTLFNFSPNGIVLEDAAGTIIDVNPAFCEMMGFSFTELVGNKIHMLTHPDVYDQVDKNIKILLRGQKLKHVEKSIKKDGTITFMELSESKFTLPNGETGIICIAEDITDRVKVQEALLISEESYKGLFNNATDAIYIQDKDGKFVDVNMGAVKMYGYPREYFIGKTPDFLSAPGKNDMNVAAMLIQKAFLGEPQKFEFWGIDKNGRIFPKEIRLNKGSYFGEDVVIAFAQDISERKQAMDALKESRRQIATLLGNLPGMAYRCLNDMNWTMEFVSEGGFELTGYEADDLICNNKISYNELIHPDDQEMVWNQVQDALKTNQSFKLSYRIYTKDKKEKWVFEQGIGIYSNDNNLIALEGFVTDITERKHAEVEIRKLSRSVEQSPTIVIITDLKGTIEYVNPKFYEITGYSQNEVIGKNPKILKSGNTPKKVYESLWKTITTGKEWYGEFHNRKKNGELYWESANIFPLKNEYGKITHFIGMKENITIRKNMEQDLIKAKEKAEESDKLKSSFLANMSHEIRTPMNAIIGFSQLLSDLETSDDERNHYINLIQNSGNDLLGLIDDIIDISKIEAGQIKIFKSQYFVDNILLELYDSYSEFLKTKKNKKDIKLIYNRPKGGQHIVIYTDIDRFKQIIKNLISNAIKFTDAGSVEFGFTVDCNKQYSNIRFYVKDTGIGVSKDKLDVIFESFRQASASDTKIYGGTGLGLAITKRLVEILGDKIWVNSIPGRGSTFYFTIPYQPAFISGDENLNGSIIKRAKKLTIDGKTLLVVEDDDQSYFFFESILKKTKSIIVRAVDGQQAVDLCKNQKFDLILMDIRLPKMDGYVATKKIKELWPDIKIIAQTAYAMAGEKERCFEAGCDDYISKPINIAELFDTIERNIK